MYLTPERFKTMGLGVDLSEFETVHIRSAIARATAAIDTFCAVPMLPQRYSFRGGTITNEEHVWPVDPHGQPRPLQIWPWHTPVRTVTACKIIWHVQGGVESYLDIDPANILIADQGYIEISSLLLSQVVFADAIAPYVGLTNPISRTSYTYGYRFTVTDEYAEPVDARTYQSQNPFWTDDEVTVKVDGVTQTTGFSFDRREGWVVFDANQDSDAEVTLSYTHSLPNDILQAAGVLVARDLGQADLRAKGMEGLVSIRVKDVELRRAVAAKSSGTAGMAAADMPDEAVRYLSGWVFGTAR